MVTSKMKLANTLMDDEYLNSILLKFVGLDYFHPESISKFVDSIYGLITLGDENPITDILTYFSEVLQDMDMTLPVRGVKNDAYNPKGIREYIDLIHERFENGVTIRRELETVTQENRGVLTQAHNIESIDSNLGDLFERKYIKVRLGKLLIDSIKKLQYYRNRPFVFKSFSTGDTCSWCVYFTTVRYEGDVNSIFSSPYFECTRTSEPVHGNPIQAKENLQEGIDNDLKWPRHVNEIVEALKAGCIGNSTDVKVELEFTNHILETGKHVLSLGRRSSITGFVVEEDVPKLKESFSNPKEVGIEIKPVHSDK